MKKIQRNELAQRLEQGHIIARITPDEMQLLYDLAREVPIGGHILEVGSAYGASATCLWAGCDPSVDLTLVDNFTFSFRHCNPNNPARLRDNLKKMGVQPYYIIAGDSKTVEIPDRQYYLVHIDGDHSYEGASSDLKRFGRSKIIVCHDYSMLARQPGVTKAVDEFLIANPRYRKVKEVMRYVVLRKVGQ